MDNTATGSRVVVITGASSGIGRATAQAFAREGVLLVLAARRTDELQRTAAECLALGAREALAVPTDVRDEAAMVRLAERALQACGRIDVWVNNAGVVALGHFEEVPSDAFRQVMETNFFGCVHGARAVLPVFRRQRHGVLVNMCSMLGVVAEPCASPYVASKFAIRGFSQSLRQELLDAPGIQVCTVLPATMDTPIFRVGANYSGRRPKAVDPAYDPAKTARTIVALAQRPRPEVVVGGFGHLLMLSRRLTPRLVERAIALAGPRLQFVPGADAAPTTGNLHVPAAPDGHRVRDGWRERSTLPLVLAGASLLLMQRLHPVGHMRSEGHQHRPGGPRHGR
jgi:NAD(P)-dependent dehydrogenase (short-subunit alcohol dehydrogenase family)